MSKHHHPAFTKECSTWMKNEVAHDRSTDLTVGSLILCGIMKGLGGLTLPANGNEYVLKGSEFVEEYSGMDNANIARKRSKPDKHGHGKGKSVQKPGI
ncbi:reverse transcriptase domain-containing protein [Tanacetum coccineum]